MATTVTAIPNRLNAFIVAAQICAVAVCMLLLRHTGSVWQIAGLALVFGIVMNSVYSTIHEAEHAMLFTDRRANDIAGVLLALLFPAPFHLIRQGHLGHHLRNRSDDEAFDFYFDGDNRVWKILVLYGILTGLYYVVVVLSNVVFLFLPFRADKKFWHVDQASTAFMESLNPRYNLAVRLESAAAVVLHVSLVWILGVPVLHYLAMYSGFGFLWSAMQYVHHYGTERHVTRGARNLWLWKPLDWILLNHNWHLTHHSHPSVPWLHLPHVELEEKSDRGFLLTAWLRMWRGPRRAQEQVRNPHAGKLIP